MKTSLLALLAIITLADVRAVRADPHATGVPVLNSRPGATYTIYLNPAGFNYSGTWNGMTPGNNPALNGVPNNGVFGPADVTEINAIWAAAANKFQPFNINVTTVDPYNAVGDLTPTDLERRDYYDSQPHMMHTVIGVGNGWQGGNDGLALGGTIGPVQTGNPVSTPIGCSLTPRMVLPRSRMATTSEPSPPTRPAILSAKPTRATSPPG